MGRFFMICGLLAAPMPGDGSAVQESAARLTVRIVPTTFRDKGGRAIELYQTSRGFHVVVTNASEGPIRLWRDWCSWGYFNLSFEVTDEEGRSVAVTRRPRGWDKNYPDWTIIPPGDHMVFEVSFDEATWQNAPIPERRGSRVVKMKAVYSIAADEKSEEHGVWTGRVLSPEEVYTLWR